MKKRVEIIRNRSVVPINLMNLSNQYTPYKFINSELQNYVLKLTIH